ncbi:MAG: NADH-quinone oxidoreductase subunit C [Acidimicrobiales bacterium]
MTNGARATSSPAGLAASVEAQVRTGDRFAGLFATVREDGSTVLRAVVATPHHLEVTEAVLPAGILTYPALTPAVPAASWYEREIHDLFGLVPSGHPRLDSLVFPRADGARAPLAGSRLTERLVPDLRPLPSHVSGEGVFTIAYGPVRSGVFESIEYLVETTGEEIPHLRTRVYLKHRGLDYRFCDLKAADAVLLAERVEGTCSVAHALAFSLALESLGDVEPPRGAELLRLVHAELERVAVHLDSVVRHTEGSGQAVAYARMSLHKETVLRLRARLCGHRFGRGVVIPGGVAGRPQMDLRSAISELARLEDALTGDAEALMGTPSFLDRLRGTGTLAPELVRAHGAVGPVARGSGLAEDVREDRPYGAYRDLGFEAVGFDNGDAFARQQVRLGEIAQSLTLVRRALAELEGSPPGPWRGEVPPVDGLALVSVEAPQGELIYLVEVKAGRLERVKPRCASFHNLALFHQAFGGDIFTDFVFIEASFGLSIAGVAG